MARRLYACCSCGYETKRKKGWCKMCEDRYRMRRYEGDHCGCRGIKGIISGQAVTEYECKICKTKDCRSNSCRPSICEECAKVNQCIYCGKRRANSIFDMRRNFLLEFYKDIENEERDYDKYGWDFDKVVNIPKQKYVELEGIIDKLNKRTLDLIARKKNAKKTT